MSQRDLWKALSGVLCVYKHSGISSTALKKLITNKISESVAEIESTSRIKLPLISLPIVEPHEKSGALVVVGTNEVADYRYHPLVSGRSIRSEDVQILDALPLATNSSGVCVFGVNDGCDQIPGIMSKSWTNSYRIDGILGKSPKKTKNPENSSENAADQKEIVSRISKNRIEKCLSRMESEFRAGSFQSANLDLESSEAFELARRGLPRAQLPGAQIVYSIELNWFRTPRFSITAQCSGEDDEMLRRLIEHIGANLGCESMTIRLQRQNFGPFGSEDSLLEKQMNLQNIVRNIHLNRQIIADASESIDKRAIEPVKAENLRKRAIFDGIGLKESTRTADFDAMRPAWPRNYA